MRDGEVFAAEEFRVEQFALEAVAVVAEYRDDGLARPEVTGEPDGAGDIDARRAAEAEALMLEQVEHIGQGFAVGDLVGVIDGEILEVGGDAALADALGDRVAGGFELSGLEILVERGALGVGEADLDIGVLRLERDGNAAQRAAGADRADEAVDLAAGLFPDFGA